MSWNDVERHILFCAGEFDWRHVEDYEPPGVYRYRRPIRGFKPALRKLARLGLLHARTASYSPIGNFTTRRDSPEKYPDFDLVQIQAVLTAQGRDLVTVLEGN